MTIKCKSGVLLNYDNIVSIGIESAAINGRYQITAYSASNTEKHCVLGIYETEAQVNQIMHGIESALSAGARVYRLPM